MSRLTRYSPFSAEPFADAFEGFLRPIRGLAEDGPRMDLDITENDKEYVLQAEIPGMNKEDIQVDIDGGEVRISAKKSSEKEVKDGDRVVRSERYWGQMQRAVSFATSIDEDHVTAVYDKGVLKLTLPKKAGDGTRRIEIS
ncbi:Hsp20/alpha crystallin family protein [Bordetella genomosp. 11]|uniref:Heat-shock protein Hsp20 n=1 Tax=Bordetella genomosp. 11 TaxID=1416808 RepID=A0A261UGL6_9BORD|nr:Hsp20 family protein [Bordetella genomosp. 11]OZI60735.1 heat-shock protein Hsp20 [Bordetella genomosp. 11]